MAEPVTFREERDELRPYFDGKWPDEILLDIALEKAPFIDWVSEGAFVIEVANGCAYYDHAHRDHFRNTITAKLFDFERW